MVAQEGLSDIAWRCWCWCLLNAARELTWESVCAGKGYSRVEIWPGQVLYHRRKVAGDLQVSSSSAYRGLKELCDARKVTVSKPKKGTLVTITGWRQHYKDADITNLDNIEVKSFMTGEKRLRVIEDLPSITKKIFECVPIKDEFTSKQILAELKRQGRTFDLKRIEACLHSLKESKLINANGVYWSRNAVATKKPEKKGEAIVRQQKTASVPAPEKTKRHPLEILDEISKKADQLKSDIESAALEISEHVEEVEANAEKMKQLKTLLKSINVQ